MLGYLPSGPLGPLFWYLHMADISTEKDIPSQQEAVAFISVPGYRNLLSVTIASGFSDVCSISNREYPKVAAGESGFQPVQEFLCISGM